MWSDNLYATFKRLRELGYIEGQFNVDGFDNDLPHKLGINQNGCPVFFVETCDSTQDVDIKLTMFSVMYNRTCDIHDLTSNLKAIRKYTVIQLNTDDSELQTYFLEVMYLVLKRLPILPETTVLGCEIKKIIALFTNAKRPSYEAIRGLFAELLVIDLSHDPAYLLHSWHITPHDKFDFNDGQDKVEVKSCTQEKREHTFALDQLYPGENSHLVIASMFVAQTGMGCNVYDLVDRISEKIAGDFDLEFHLRSIVTETVGKYFHEVSEFRFDYGISSDSYALYDSVMIPKLDKEAIPEEISRVRFAVDLSGVPYISSDSYESKLIRSLL